MSTIVHFEIHIDPAKLGEAPRVLRETLAATRAWPGNEGLEVLTDNADPCHIVVVEKWSSTQAHDSYSEWRSKPAGKNDLGTILAAPPALQRYSNIIHLGI
ncbi:putative quinol monooxygenase [Arthrobacter sp. S2(2024)]|uniref:putative quinol monooxygenase n=1 Tax=Arthrobacter sp. S2(2024) TaxID=3111911 RepID=UPI002FC7194D